MSNRNISTKNALSRRKFLAYFSGLGLSSTLLPGILWAKYQEEKIVTKNMLRDAEILSGLEFTEEERELMLQGLEDNLKNYKILREIEIENSVSPAIYFNPVPAGVKIKKGKSLVKPGSVRPPKVPSNLEELAFYPVTHLSKLIFSGKVSSTELTKMYLSRLKKYDPKLKFLVTLTEELALEQAGKADREIAAGKYRGALHGIPWGAKDLLAVKGYKTTWGAMPYKDQIIDTDATVVKKLEEAGAVLIGKLTLGALAMGDVWFDGKTRNPWNPEQGSSGSSAGPGSATAAGCVGFSIGTETWGSIVSPSTRCGVTGLRPTFGRVSRYGAMALSWSMDKIGPMCRSVEDCALVFNAIYGPDGKDISLYDYPFNYNARMNIRNLRIGYYKSAFDAERRRNPEGKANDDATLEKLKSMGLNMIPIELPDYPVSAISFILSAEASAAFSELTLSNRDDLLVRQGRGAWPNSFRQARFIPAVEYIQANRLRTKIMEEMAKLFDKIDLYVTPSYGGSNLLLTNLTGHPCLVLPNGFRENGTPTSISFIGNLFDEGKILSVAKAYQDATDFHLKYPKIDT